MGENVRFCPHLTGKLKFFPARPFQRHHTKVGECLLPAGAIPFDRGFVCLYTGAELKGRMSGPFPCIGLSDYLNN